MIDKPVCDYENYDGVAYEENKSMYRKLSSPKSRWSWSCSHVPDEDWDAIFSKGKNGNKD